MGALNDLYLKGNYCDHPYRNFFEVKARDINENLIQMDTFNKKIIIIVNFNPFDDKTKDDFERLMRLKDQFEDKVNILAFPSTQIDKMEISSKEIREKIESEYINATKDKINIFRKVYLNGEECGEVYKFCYRASPLFQMREGKAKFLEQNLTKFIIDRNGKVYSMHNPNEDYNEIEQNIKYLLAQRIESVEIRKSFIDYNKFH